MSDTKKKKIITIGGYVGGGKSTIGEAVAKQLGLTHYSSGDFMRAMAKDLGMSFADFDRVIRTTTEESVEYNRQIDARPTKVSAEEDNVVMDGHVAFHFAPGSFKVYLDIDAEIAAQRIFEQDREDEPYESVDEVLTFVKDRASAMQERFIGLYDVDIRDLSHYDLVIDSGLPENDIPSVINQVIEGFHKWLER